MKDDIMNTAELVRLDLVFLLRVLRVVMEVRHLKMRTAITTRALKMSLLFAGK
jgi:hypothetical protein